jgi:hypothetical protein
MMDKLRVTYKVVVRSIINDAILYRKEEQKYIDITDGGIALGKFIADNIDMDCSSITVDRWAIVEKDLINH